MTRGLGDPGRRRATVLAALLQLTSLQATVPAGGAQTCTGKTNITFTATANHTPKYDRHEHTGVRNLVGWMQRHFAALVLHEPSIPQGLLPLNDTYDAVGTVVSSTTGMSLIVVLSCILAVLVPVMGLLVLCCRCACGLCGGGSEQETKKDIGKRNTWGCLFSVCYLPLM